jgi:hypothetical protein
MWNIEGKQVSSVMVSGDYTNACMLVWQGKSFQLTWPVFRIEI